MSNLFGIIGFGVVGQATASMLGDEEESSDFIFLDPKYTESSSPESILQCRGVFVCVNTTYKKGKHNYHNLHKVLTFLYDNQYKGIVYLRTTCHPSEVKFYHQKLRMVAMPEFLNQNSAYEDELKNPIILGCDYNLFLDARSLLAFTKYKKFLNCTFDEAILLKLTRNLYGAYKVLFWNFIQDFTGNTRKMYSLYKMIVEQGDMEKLAPDGKRGYGGKCFPKDVQIVLDAVKGSDKWLPEFMTKYNRYLRDPEE